MARYIKKIEKDEKFISSCLGIAQEAEHRVKQNNCVDIYRDYFRYTDEVGILDITRADNEGHQRFYQVESANTKHDNLMST